MGHSEKKEKKDEKAGAFIRLGPKILEMLSKLGEVELEDVEIEAEELEIWIPMIVPQVVPAPPAAPAT
ncbi:MAG: hypothetical protein QW113_04095, partial [Candidatus Bathyarchaeia archaeon]